MIGIATKNLPNPSTNTTPSTTQDYLAQAMGAPQAPKKKKPLMTDAGGQLFRGQDRKS